MGAAADVVAVDAPKPVAWLLSSALVVPAAWAVDWAAVDVALADLPNENVAGAAVVGGAVVVCGAVVLAVVVFGGPARAANGLLAAAVEEDAVPAGLLAKLANGFAGGAAAVDPKIFDVGAVVVVLASAVAAAGAKNPLLGAADEGAALKRFDAVCCVVAV